MKDGMPDLEGARHLCREEGTAIAPWRVKACGDDTGGRFDFLVGEVAYRSGPPLHRHRVEEDSFYVLEGILTVQSGERVFEVGPGEFVTFLPGTAHTFDNLRPDQPPVRVINLMTPGGYDRVLVVFSEAGTQALDEATARSLEERFGVEIVGPPLRDSLERAGTASWRSADERAPPG
ncbi:cupin domain-containing protein [Luteimonas aquatica]|uniref:cupin domain-containing protein n=1 Tax=Luteimonas aquatica TaxID=450364 RepID=UPI001F577928|nr:cupin domain-containing protein [Luteimonas aquatica]